MNYVSYQNDKKIAMSSRKRKRLSTELKRVVFADDVQNNHQKGWRESASISSAKCWRKCGDSFQDLPAIKSSGKKQSAIRRFSKSNREKSSIPCLSKDQVDIAWSSSDEQSDNDIQEQPQSEVVRKKQRPPQKTRKPTAPITSHPATTDLTPANEERSSIPRLSKDQVDIAWSSSDEQSDNDLREQHQFEVVRKKRRPPQKAKKPTAPITSHSALIDMIPTNEDDLPVIDNDSDLDESGKDAETESVQQISDCESDSDDDLGGKGFPPRSNNVEELEIADYLSDGENACSTFTSSKLDSKVLPPQTDEDTKRSVSKWVRSAQTMLQAPRKSSHWHPKHTEASAKKKEKFKSGGLAERLSQLESRQRSAISFWRHESISGTCGSATLQVNKPGVLVLEVLQVHQECGLKVAYCEHLSAPGDGQQYSNPVSGANTHMLVLLNMETARQLMVAPKDIIQIHPPWQSLSIKSFSYPVILNAQFSRKVFSASKSDNVSFPSIRLSEVRPRPIFLGKTIELLNECRNNNKSTAKQITASSSELLMRHSISLLDAIEGLGHPGYLKQDVEVVVQRVYSIPFTPCYAVSNLKQKLLQRSIVAPVEKGETRLCMLTQDDYGTFSVVQLHSLSRSDQLDQYCQMWQGRTCVLKNIRVVQQVTRERRRRLFSLIDSLWPPAVPLQVHGNSLSISSVNRSPCSAPSFCYLLSGEQSSVKPTEGQTVPPLYLPPTKRTLRDILQSEMGQRCCSFFATVIYKKIEYTDGGRGEVWLVITDPSLQEDQLERPCKRTMTVCVNTSCVLTSSVLEALNSPTVCHMSFTDAIKEHDFFHCVEQSHIEVSSAPIGANGESTTRPDSLSQPVKEPKVKTMPQPVRLDPLSVETTPNSLCSLTGVIVGVDEQTAFSWPACNLCGSDDLKLSNSNFYCVSCKSLVTKPDIKIKLDVFLECPTISSCTIKVKLHQKTIMSVLNTTLLQCEEGCDVESVLGKEVGPISAYVQLLARKPALWFALDEVCLQGSGCTLDFGLSQFPEPLCPL